MTNQITEIQLHSLLESIERMAKIGVWKLDLSTREVTWSNEVYRIHEIPIGTYIDVINGVNFYHEESRPIVEKALKEAINNGHGYDHEVKLMTPTGDTKWLRAIGIPQKDENGKVFAVQGLFQDIDKQKRIEEELSQKQQILEMAINAGEVGIWNWGIDDGNLAWNHQMHDMFDWPVSNFKGKFEDFSDRVHHEDMPRVNEALQAAMQEGIKYNIEYRVITRGGKTRVIKAKGDLIKNYEGKHTNMIGTCIDITEQKKAAKAHEVMKQRLELFIKHTPAAVAMFDNNLHYIAVSDRWYKDYKITEKSIIGKHYYDVFPEIKKIPEWQNDHQLVLQGASVKKSEDLFIRENGEQQWLRYELYPWYKADGKIGGMGMFTEDITQTKEYHASLERQVQQRTKKLETINQELQAFSYSVSHDLRSPLRAVHGFAEALSTEYGGQLDELGKDYLTRIRKGTTRMGQLIDDLLELSRVSRTDMLTRKVDLTAITKEVISDIKGLYTKEQHAFEIEEGLTTYGDSKLLKIALENLVNNACKFSANRESPCVTIGMEKKSNGVQFFVKDNGAGFDMKYKDKLFSAFQRLHNAKDFPGTGIGLAIVKRIITRHAGNIWAESSPESGTIFYFTTNHHHHA